MGKNLKPLLINQEGVFFIFRKGVEMMDMEGNKDNEDMGMAKIRINNFKKSILLSKDLYLWFVANENLAITF